MESAKKRWVAVTDRLPDEGEEVFIRVQGGEVRMDYYHIRDRWYSLDDLHRWQMNTSRYWATDRSWYLKTEQLEAWLEEVESEVSEPP